MTDLEASSWSSYPKILPLGHRGLDGLFNEPVTVEEKIDGCVTPDTPILLADLRYVPAGSLKAGDELLAFEDTLNDPRLCPSLVTFAEPIEKDAYEIITTHRQVRASADHPWLIGKPASHSKSTNSKKQWITSENLTQGDQIVSLPVWTEDRSWEAGWLAGMFDGEGSLVQHGNGRVLSVYQRSSETADKIESTLNALGFTFSIDVRQRGDYQEMKSFVVRGGWTEILRLLGTIRPGRLLEKAPDLWAGAAMNFLPRETVLSIKHVGVQTVTGLSTSSKTYVANGLLCHNSQFSFGRFGDEIRIRSKGKVQNLDAPDQLFNEAASTVKGLAPNLVDGWTYRGEYLKKPRHNALAYDRVPTKHIIIFDIATGPERYLSYAEKAAEAERLGLECVPLLYEGKVTGLDQLMGFLDRVSILGGAKAEGFVVKNHARFGLDGKPLIGKFVSEAFKEVHRRDWAKQEGNKPRGDLIEEIAEAHRTEARWRKAIQHLAEDGRLTDSPADIGNLIKEVQADIQAECIEEIKQALWVHARPQILRRVIAGLPEWYKEQLAARSFAPEDGE